MSRLLQLHFKDDKTKGTGRGVGGTSETLSRNSAGPRPGVGGGRSGAPSRSRCVRVPHDLPCLAVSGDALQLMAELLKIFVVGESGAHAPSGHRVQDSFCVFTAGKPRRVFPSFPQGPKLGSPEPVCQVLWPGSGGCPWVWVGAPSLGSGLRSPTLAGRSGASL